MLQLLSCCKTFNANNNFDFIFDDLHYTSVKTCSLKHGVSSKRDLTENFCLQLQFLFGRPDFEYDREIKTAVLTSYQICLYINS